MTLHATYVVASLVAFWFFIVTYSRRTKAKGEDPFVGVFVAFAVLLLQLTLLRVAFR